MVRTLREDEPLKPSSRVSQVLSNEGAGLTGERRTALRTRANRLRGDLDWIVMCCLEKDRSRRYSTPNGLAMDIQRYLDHEPVLAGPPSTVYRLRKFVARNRAGVTAAAIVAAALILGMVGTSIGFLRAEDARQEEARQRRTAETMYSFLSEQFITAVSPDQMGGDVTMRAVLDAAAPGIGEHFKGMPVAESGVRMTVGETYFKLGAYPEALEQFTSAYDLRRVALGPLDPDTLEAEDGIGHALLVMRRLDEAEPLLIRTMNERLEILGETHEDTLDTMSKVAALRYFKGDLPGAIEVSRRVYKLRTEGWGPEHEETIRAASSLAELLRRHGEQLVGAGDAEEGRAIVSEAQSLLEHALQVSTAAHGEKAPITLFVMHNLAGFYDSQGDYERSVPLLERTLALRREVMLDDHPRTLGTLIILARAYQRGGRTDDAIRVLTDVLTSARRRGASDRNARLAMRLLGSLLLRSGRPDEAADWYEATVEAIDAAGEDESLEATVARRLHAGALRDAGKLDEAAGELREAYDIAVRVRGSDDGVTKGIAAEMTRVLTQAGASADEITLWRSRSSNEGDAPIAASDEGGG
jgi:tetratricopeptide (TPR) repeat protein